MSCAVLDPSTRAETTPALINGTLSRFVRRLWSESVRLHKQFGGKREKHIKAFIVDSGAEHARALTQPGQFVVRSESRARGMRIAEGPCLFIDEVLSMHSLPTRFRGSGLRRNSFGALRPRVLYSVAFVGAWAVVGCGDGESGGLSHFMGSARGRTGAVRFEGTANVCPEISPLSAAPLETAVGSTIDLEASVWDPDSRPSGVTVNWSAPDGFLATGLRVKFPCKKPSTVVVTATVTDGDVGCLVPSKDPYAPPVTADVELTCLDPSVP